MYRALAEQVLLLNISQFRAPPRARLLTEEGLNAIQDFAQSRSHCYLPEREITTLRHCVIHPSDEQLAKTFPNGKQ